MQVEQAIRERRASYTNQFSGDSIADEQIEKMMDLANWAPSHRHTEPWRFRIYEGEAMHALLDDIANLYVRFTPSDGFKPAFAEKMAKRKQQLSHLLIISLKRHEIVPEFEELASVAMAVQNIWLYLASQEDIGGYWSTPAVVLSKEFHHLVDMEEDEKCLGLFYLGKLKNVSREEAKRGDWKKKVSWFKN